MDTLAELRQQITTVIRADHDRIKAMLGRPDCSWRVTATISQGLRTMAALRVDVNADDLAAASDAWDKRHAAYRRMNYDAEGAYAGVLATLLWAWAEQAREITEAPDYVPAEWSGVGA